MLRSLRFCTSERTQLLGLIGLAGGYAVLHGAIFLCLPRFEPATHNDDWVYAYSVQALCQGDGLQLHRLTGALALPQIVGGWLVCLAAGGFSYGLLRGTMVLLGFLPVAFFWSLLRRLGIAPGPAAWASLLFLVNPLLVSLTWSFQTDVIFLTFVLAGLWMTVVADQQGRVSAFVGSLAVLLCACLTRQTALVVIVAVAAYWVFRRRYLAAVLTLTVGAAMPALERWLTVQSSLTYLPFVKQQLAAALSSPSVGRLIHTVFEGLHLLAFLGLLLLPLSLATAEWKRWRWWLAAASAAAVLLFVHGIDSLTGRAALPGNYLYWGQRWGVGPPTLNISSADTVGVAAAAVRSWPNQLLGLLAVMGGALLIPRVVRSAADVVRAARRLQAEPRTLLHLAFWAATGGIVLTSAFLGRPIFDRYALVLWPLAIPACWPEAPTNRRLAAWCVPAILLGLWLSWAGTVDYWRWNAARWQALGWLAEQGVPPECIDGGYEYNGIHATLGIPEALRTADDRARQAAIEHVRAGRDTFTVTFGTPRRGDAVRDFPYRSPLFRAPQSVVVVRDPVPQDSKK